jgi:hypothetical protein
MRISRIPTKIKRIIRPIFTFLSVTSLFGGNIESDIKGSIGGVEIASFIGK